jgi:hypothetical protein
MTKVFFVVCQVRDNSFDIQPPEVDLAYRQVFVNINLSKKPKYVIK